MLNLKKQFFILLSIASLVSCDDSSLQTKCSSQFSKLMPCLDYSTGKANTPSSECCSSATDIRKSNAACLCFVIQQTHDGNENIKSLGIQFDRLLLLPADCKLANSNVSDCPRLLNLSPSSPDYSIFTNTNASTGSSSSSTDTASKSNGIKRQVMMHFSSITALLSAIILSIF